MQSGPNCFSEEDISVTITDRKKRMAKSRSLFLRYLEKYAKISFISLLLNCGQKLSFSTFGKS